MTDITLSTVQKLSKLSRIAINPNDAPALATQLSSILKLIETMQAVDTTGIEPLAHPTAFVSEVALRLRDDCITESADIAQRDLRMQNAPAMASGYFLVPQVIE